MADGIDTIFVMYVSTAFTTSMLDLDTTGGQVLLLEYCGRRFNGLEHHSIVIYEAQAPEKKTFPCTLAVGISGRRTALVFYPA